MTVKYYDRHEDKKNPNQASNLIRMVSYCTRIITRNVVLTRFFTNTNIEAYRVLIIIRYFRNDY